MRNPRNGATLKTLVLEGNDWVNVAAITPEDNIIIVRQFRFGTGRTTAEFPAGLSRRVKRPWSPPNVNCAKKPATQQKIGSHSAVLMPTPSFLIISVTCSWRATSSKPPKHISTPAKASWLKKSALSNSKLKSKQANLAMPFRC